MTLARTPQHPIIDGLPVRPCMILLAALIIKNCDTSGCCPRSLLRQAYASDQRGDNRQFTHKHSVIVDSRVGAGDERTRQFRTASRGVKSSALGGGGGKGKGSTQGRKSSDRLQRDLSDLEKIGAILRLANDTVQVSDWKAIAELVKEQP